MRSGERGESRDGVGVPDDEHRYVFQSGSVEEFRPIESPCLAEKFDSCPRNRRMHILGFNARGMQSCHSSFESKDASGAGRGLGESGEAQHGFDVGAVQLAESCHLRRGGKVIVAVGKPEPALEQIRIGVSGVGEALCYPDAEQVASVEVCVVEGVDIGAEAGA